MHTYAIITCAPNEIAGAVHDRMHLVIDPPHFDDWLRGTGSELPVPYRDDLVIDPPPPAGAHMV